jgi:hypothetical protein
MNLKDINVMEVEWLRIFDIKLSLDLRVIYIFKRVDGDRKVQLPYMIYIRCGIPLNNMLHKSLDNKPNTDLKARTPQSPKYINSPTRTPTRIQKQQDGTSASS